MSKAKKIFLIPLGIVLLLIVAAVVVAYLYLNTIVKNQVETQGTKATGVQTTLGGANLSLFSGGLTLDNFALANPQGFTTEAKLFAFDDAAVQVKVSSLFSDEIVVPELVVDGATVQVLLEGKKLNIQALMENLKQQGQTDDAGTPEDPADPEDTDDPGAAQAVVINDLRITNTKVVGQLELFPGQPPLKVDLVLADIIKTDVRGAEMADVIAFVVQTVMRNTSRELAQVTPDLDAFVGGAQNTGNQVIDDVTNKIDEALPGTGLGEVLNERGKQELDNALGDLFNRDKKKAPEPQPEATPAPAE